MKGLQRIRIFEELSGNEFGTASYTTHWLLEDGDDFFVVLGNHSIRGVEIDNYEKAQYRYEEV